MASALVMDAEIDASRLGLEAIAIAAPRLDAKQDAPWTALSSEVW
jgi:hypothetical protein